VGHPTPRSVCFLTACVKLTGYHLVVTTCTGCQFRNRCRFRYVGTCRTTWFKYCPLTPLQPLKVSKNRSVTVSITGDFVQLPLTAELCHCLSISCRTLITTCSGCLETAYLCWRCRISPVLRPDIDFTAQGARPSTRKVR
jgi:hypothetical protein